MRRAQRPALGDLGRVPRGADVRATRDRQRGDVGGVGGAPREDDVGAGRERCVDLLDTGQRDDVAAALDAVSVEGRRGFERAQAALLEVPTARVAGAWLAPSAATRSRWPRDAAISRVMSSIHPTVASVPQVPQLPSTSGTPASARACIRVRHCAAQAFREYFEVPVPR